MIAIKRHEGRKKRHFGREGRIDGRQAWRRLPMPGRPTHRPRTEAQKQRRKALWEARAEASAKPVRRRRDAERRPDRAPAWMSAGGRPSGPGPGRDRALACHSTRPLDEITDDAERFSVLKARVERLEALWSIDRRKRETRGKIILGGALLAELIDAGLLQAAIGEPAGRRSLHRDILDRHRVRDRPGSTGPSGIFWATRRSALAPGGGRNSRAINSTKASESGWSGVHLGLR